MHKYFLPILLSLAFFIAGLLTLSDYGINWDAPVHMMRGQAYAHFYLTGQRTYNLPEDYSPMIIRPGEIASRYYFIPEERWTPIGPLPQRPLFQKQTDEKLSFYQSEIWNGEYWLKYDQPHLPLIDTLSAFSNRFFWGVLGWLGDIESYQLVYVLISALGVFIVSLFAYELSGFYLASAVAGLSLALFPIFFTESHINMKDPSQAVFFMGSIWAFWHWVKEDKLKWFGMFIAFIALALATKWNIVFLPLILIPWLFTIRKTAEFKAWFKLGSLREARKLGWLGGLGVLGILLFLLAIWPAAWNNPVGKMVEVTKYYLDIGTGVNKLQPEGFLLAGFNFYPLISTLVQTPEIILALGGIGVIGMIREILRRSLPRVESRGSGQGRGELKVGYLLLIWLLVPIFRITIPGMNSYTGMRQIMEILPAMALLAGVGGSYLAKKISRNIIIIIIIIMVITIILLRPIIKLHTNQNAYFNILAHVLPVSIKTKLNNWTITYGNIYKQGVKWLNEHAEKNANIAHLQGGDFAISPLWLREDISISPYHFSGFEQKGEYIMALYNPLDPPVFAKRYPEKFLKPVYKIEIDRVPLLFIYKNDSRFNILDLSKKVELNKFIAQQKGDDFGDYWEIILDKEYQVTRILVDNQAHDCSEGLAINELIFFDTSDPAAAFVLNEKKILADRIIEYDFPAQPARQIRIYPQNESSCFAQGKILSVSFVSN